MKRNNPLQFDWLDEAVLFNPFGSGTPKDDGGEFAKLVIRNNPGTIPAENDLIRMDIAVSSVSGIEYKIRTSVAAPYVRLWDSSLKDGYPVHTVNGGSVVVSSKTVYAEYISSGNASVTFELVAILTATETELFTEEITFRPFESITAAFVGENTQAGGNDALSQWTRDRLLDGYDVWVFDDGHDVFSSIVDCDEFGEGNALNEIANEINNQGITEVAIVGYSHGGGSVYNLSKRLFYDGQTTMYYGVNRTQSNLIDDSKIFSLPFTSYIDAIENTGWSSGNAEIRKPLGSGYHLNQYQTSGSYAGGATIGGGIIENIDRTGTVLGSTLINSFFPHIVILYEESVLYILKTRFLSHINR